jgi:hypothetical protein
MGRICPADSGAYYIWPRASPSAYILGRAVVMGNRATGLGNNLKLTGVRAIEMGSSDYRRNRLIFIGMVC